MSVFLFLSLTLKDLSWQGGARQGERNTLYFGWKPPEEILDCSFVIDVRLKTGEQGSLSKGHMYTIIILDIRTPGFLENLIWKPMYLLCVS